LSRSKFLVVPPALAASGSGLFSLVVVAEAELILILSGSRERTLQPVQQVPEHVFPPPNPFLTPVLRQALAKKRVE
jgi:hypothetical protein